MRHRADTVQASIVKGLRQGLFRVWVIGRPCDLLVYYWSNKRGAFRFQTLECKTPTKTGKRRKRFDQDEQDRFIADTHTPIVLSLDEALAALEAA